MPPEPQDLDALPEITAAALAQAGYLPVQVSVFDHWLEESEADAEPLLFYALALQKGALPAYLAGERQFLAFYRRLAEDGAWIRVNGTARPLEPAELEMILLSSLRENQPMDIWFESPPVRVLGGYDRTDTVLTRSADAAAWVSALAREKGLFVLE